MKKHVRKSGLDNFPAIARAILATTICMGAAGFLVQNFNWISSRVLWAAIGLQDPPASAWYLALITNDSERELMVSVRVLNDRTFEVRRPLEQFNRAMMGKALTKTAVLLPGESELFEIVSEEDCKLGFMEVSAFSRIEESGNQGRWQDFALLILPWAKLGPGSEPSEIVINQSSLLRLDESEVSQLGGKSVFGSFKLRMDPKTEISIER